MTFLPNIVRRYSQERRSQSLKKGPFTRRSDNFRDNDTKSKICISYFSEKENLQALKFDEIAKVDVPYKVVAYCSRSGAKQECSVWTAR